LLRALRLREVVSKPALGKLLLDGMVNALRDLARSPRPNLPPAGKVQFHYRVGGGLEPAGEPPGYVQRWFPRSGPVLASAARMVYVNDDKPLSEKLPRASQLLVRQVNIFDVLACLVIAVMAGATGLLMSAWGRLRRALWGKRSAKSVKGLYPRY